MLSVLIPRLHDVGVNISMYVGTSAGAINATIFAALSHLSPAEQAQRALDVWRGLKISDVFESPVITSPGVALRFFGQTLRVPGLRLTSLLDTEPLRRKAETAIDWNQLRSNIDNQALTLAVAATSGTTAAPWSLWTGLLMQDRCRQAMTVSRLTTSTLKSDRSTFSHRPRSR